jgi:hypothetical protein
VRIDDLICAAARERGDPKSVGSAMRLNFEIMLLLQFSPVWAMMLSLDIMVTLT